MNYPRHSLSGINDVKRTTNGLILPKALNGEPHDLMSPTRGDTRAYISHAGRYTGLWLPVERSLFYLGRRETAPIQKRLDFKSKFGLTVAVAAMIAGLLGYGTATSGTNGKMLLERDNTSLVGPHIL
jgi:hypothetical protein